MSERSCTQRSTFCLALFMGGSRGRDTRDGRWRERSWSGGSAPSRLASCVHACACVRLKVFLFKRINTALGLPNPMQGHGIFPERVTRAYLWVCNCTDTDSLGRPVLERRPCRRRGPVHSPWPWDTLSTLQAPQAHSRLKEKHLCTHTPASLVWCPLGNSDC